MFDALRRRLARFIAPVNGRSNLHTRMYQAAKSSRLTAGFGSPHGSADSELVSSLPQLRSRSRALMRDAPYAKRAKVIIQNNVIGSGIGLQSQIMSSRDQLREDLNDAVEEAFCDWSSAENCHTGGALHFSDLERMLMGQVVEAGEVFVRKHYSRFGNSEVPIALEVVEAERIADEFMSPVPPGPAAPGALIRMGVEVDKLGRAIAYWIRHRHPGELKTPIAERDWVERVPAEQIIHLRIVDRWPQTRGEPWLHNVARKLNDMDGYTEAEIIAARGAANYMASIESDDQPTPIAEQTGAPDAQHEMALEPGIIFRPRPGEKLNFLAPNRPNASLDPFMRYMLREMAAGVGVSYESLSRDYSQSNFSSSRLALLDDRDLWRMLQQWFIRAFREPLHKEWLQLAVLAGAVPGIRIEEYALAPEKFEEAVFKPRGWGWIDPLKEVEAYRLAVIAGFTTVEDVIAQTGNGRDLEDVLRARQRELKMMKERELVYDTSPEVYTVAPSNLAPKVVSNPKDKPGEPQETTTPGNRVAHIVEAALLNAKRPGGTLAR